MSGDAKPFRPFDSLAALAAVSTRPAPKPAEKSLSPNEARDAHRRGKLLVEKLPSGTKRLVNPFRRDRKALMLAHGITTARQWAKLKKQLRREGRS